MVLASLFLGGALFGCTSDPMDPGALAECPGPDCVCDTGACSCSSALGCLVICADVAAPGSACDVDCTTPGSVCETDCGTETCNVDCESMANCDIESNGGDFDAECRTGSVCTATATGDNAEADCESGADCTFTLSGADTEVWCRSDSVCEVTAGRDSDFRCEGAECDVTLGDEGDVECSMGATCRVTCEEDCSVACRDGSTCSVRCPGQEEFMTVEEQAEC